MRWGRFAVIFFLLYTSLSGFAQNYCIPQTLAHCCDYGITQVSLPGINQNSQTGVAGYENFSQLLSENIEGNNIPISLQTGGIEPHDIRVWIDADNNGTFEHPQEMVFERLASISPSGSLTLPNNTLFNTNLRLRIMADFAGSNPMPCSNPSFGQAEDYSLKIISSGEVPVANFNSEHTTTCNGIIHFNNLSTGNPSTYLWDFGDGNTSNQASASHQYITDGSYDITLIVSNSVGADTLTMDDYIQVNILETCDTFQVPAHGTSSILYTCNYVLTDNGRNGNYSDNTNGLLSLSPVLGEKVCIRFSEFHFEQEFDYLEIFDGPSAASPLMGKYTGNSLPPNTCSSGPALSICQVSDDIVNYSGFVAQVVCTMDINEWDEPTIFIYPNPIQDQFTVSFPQAVNEWKLELYALDGKCVFSKKYNTSSAVIFPENITAGIYVAYITSGTRTWQQKISKVR